MTESSRKSSDRSEELTKHSHEFRDPIHGFIRLSSDERRVVDSAPFQRLRHIHQLALTYLVYPGATHRRFEHSLGVTELATRVFDTVTREENVHHDVIRELTQDQFRKEYWLRVLRVAALCHDMGHLPFSHAAERELLPDGWDHERLTRNIILESDLTGVLEDLKLNPRDVAKIAVGPKKSEESFSDVEALVSEIITGDAFGADRMDYLLRDSLHAGVAYGRFDHYRLIDTLRVLDTTAGGSKEPTLGMEKGGLHSAEALLLARFFMFTQLYCHSVRRIYDIHLKDFLKEWLPAGQFPTSVADLTIITDNEVSAAMLTAARDTSAKGHDPARRIVSREHFRLLYERNPEDHKRNPRVAGEVSEQAEAKFGSEHVRFDSYKQKGSSPDFPVLCDDGRVQSSLVMSGLIRELLVVAIDYVFVSPECREDATMWLEKQLPEIVEVEKEES